MKNMPSLKLAHFFLYGEDNIPLNVCVGLVSPFVGSLRLRLNYYKAWIEIHSNVTKEYLRSKMARTCWTRFIVTI